MLQYRDLHDESAGMIAELRSSGERLGDSREPWAYYRHNGNLYRVYNDDDCVEIGDFEEYCAFMRSRDLSLPWWTPAWRKQQYPESYQPT